MLRPKRERQGRVPVVVCPSREPSLTRLTTMEFTEESAPISTLPAGTICIGESDYDEGNKMGFRYVVQEKNGGKTVDTVRFDPKTGTRSRVTVPATMRVCKAIGQG